MALPSSLRSHLAALRARFLAARSSAGVMMALGAATGLATGLLAAGLIGLIRLVKTMSFGAEANPLEVVLVPTVGALVVGLLVTYWAYEPSGSGVVRTMETLALHGGRARRRTPAAGITATSVALGTGASGGREGPIVLVGGSIGSLLGQWFGLGEEGLRALIAAGAAAGIGASFNAPIAGMLFAIELIIGGLRARSLQVIVISAVVGSVTARQLVGAEIIYEPEVAHALNDPRELLLYALLGLAAAGVGLAFLYLEDWAGALFSRLRRQVWKPATLALGGLIVGVIALVVPEVLGTGDNLPPIDGLRDPIQAMLDLGSASGGEGPLPASWGTVGFLLLLLVAKLVATAASVGSGNAVGTFAPAVFTGAALGGAFGVAADLLMPSAGVEPAAFALVGMAAVFAGAARAPLTAILIAFELTGDYELVLPLMLAAGIAVFVADRIHGDSIYLHPLRKRGIVYAQPEDVDIMQTVRVREVMTTDHPTVAADLPLDELRRRFAETRSHGFAVVEGDKLVGIVTLSDLRRAEEGTAGAGATGPRRLTAEDVCTRRVLTVTPDDPVYRALHRMAAIDVGRVPVVEAGSWKLVGMVRRGDVVQAYQRAINRSLTDQQHRESRRLRDLAGVRFVEYVVDPESEVAGSAVRDIAWPNRTVLTSIRRQGEVVMPTGDTVLEAGDEVVVLTAVETTDEVRNLIGRHADEPMGTPIEAP